MVQSQSDAKRFFASRVVQQARAEGESLSDAEQRMLFWSESDPECRADPELADQLAAEISDVDYEGKISGLLERAFAADRAADPHAADAWRQAREVLKQGDHYISVMIDQAVGRRLKRWWQFWI